MTTEEGAAANYQPFKTLGSYVLQGPGRVVNKNGEVIQTAIKPGTRVRVYYETPLLSIASKTQS